MKIERERERERMTGSQINKCQAACFKQACVCLYKSFKSRGEMEKDEEREREKERGERWNEDLQLHLNKKQEKKKELGLWMDVS